MPQTILVVDDEQAIVDVLRYNLEKGGYDVVTANNGVDALRLAHQHHPDLAVLDIGMPQLDGLEVCGKLRHELGTPVILLTARDTEIDKIIGLEVGADDYVTKPFSPREVAARVKAVLRRVKSPSGTATVELHHGNVALDTLKHEVHVNGELIPMATKEFCLLEYLMRNAGVALGRNVILDRVWGLDYYGDSRTVDVHIRRLREKIEADPANPTLILTIPGVGYKYQTEEE